jgi:hypothetical protein
MAFKSSNDVITVRSVSFVKRYRTQPMFVHGPYDQPGTDGPDSYGARLQSTLNQIPPDWELIQIVSTGDVDWGVFKVSDVGADRSVSCNRHRVGDIAEITQGR